MKIIPRPILPPLPEAEFVNLVESIRLHGVQVPLIVGDDGTLIDGHERLRACVELRVKKYPLRVVGNLSEEERRELAVRINIERRHLSRAERQDLLASILAASPSKSTREVADLLKIDPRTVGRAKSRLIAGGAFAAPDATVGRDGKSYRLKPAVSAEYPHQAEEAGRLMQALGDLAPAGGTTLRTLRHHAFALKCEEEAAGPLAGLPAEVAIEHCDFRELEGRVGDLTGKIDLLLMDPPWKVEFSNLRQPMAEMAGRLLKPGGVLLLYSGHLSLPSFAAALAGHLDYVWAFAAINTPQVGPLKVRFNIKTSWRPILMYSKGPISTPRTVQDVIYSEASEKYRHPKNWQQPIGESIYFIENLTRPGALVCDLFVGSGTVPTAVATVGGGRRFVGCDTSLTCVKIARKRVRGSTSGMGAPGAREGISVVVVDG